MNKQTWFLPSECTLHTEEDTVKAPGHIKYVWEMCTKQGLLPRLGFWRKSHSKKPDEADIPRGSGAERRNGGQETDSG